VWGLGAWCRIPEARLGFQRVSGALVWGLEVWCRISEARCRVSEALRSFQGPGVGI
jgi:hypothetical protein